MSCARSVRPTLKSPSLASTMRLTPSLTRPLAASA
ncbi:Uncharacterised protein [Bordetella pertussis]|nr:Uncharacterised protein [Bordetella pertussis]CFP70180.1 Uncharacterised protein [Bordetella pertussis]